MCGISGYIGNQKIEDSILKKTLSLMINRGPDSQNIYKVNFKEINVYLLHSRLSIIDLTEYANQPFNSYDKTLIFNGEIYNYLELKDKLSKKGYVFKTKSDTEVLLAAFNEYEEKVFEHLNGMWSFAIWDDKTKLLYLSRDIFGEKPLYLLKTSHGVYFASEVKFIKALLNEPLKINENYINNFIIYGYRVLNKTNNSFFKSVKKVKNATFLKIDSNLAISEKKYFSPKFNEKNQSKDITDEIKEKLINSVGLRLRSDVPISFCLSGGVDSSGLASIASKIFNYKIKTYSIIDSDEKYNESENIKHTINDLGCEHYPIKINYSDMSIRLKKLIEYHDAPITTISYLVHSLISEEISKTQSKVVISGTGADELFSGYYDHFLFHFTEFNNDEELQENIDFWKKSTGKFIRNRLLKDPFRYIKDKDFRENFYPEINKYSKFLKIKKEKLLPETFFCNSLLRNRLLNELFFETVPVMLNEDDLNSMYYSIENRSPFLDKDLLNSVLKIPSVNLIQKGYGKYYLRKVLKGILNDKVRLDKRKIGFNVSIKNVFNFNHRRTIENFMDNTKIFEIYRKDDIFKLLKKKEITESEQKFLFNFINLKFFFECN